MDADGRFFFEGWHVSILRPALEHNESRLNHVIVLLFELEVVKDTEGLTHMYHSAWTPGHHRVA